MSKKTTGYYYDVLVLQSKKSTCLGLAEKNAYLTVSKVLHLPFGTHYIIITEWYTEYDAY